MPWYVYVAMAAMVSVPAGMMLAHYLRYQRKK